MTRAGEDNPFDRYGIDPREGPAAITARMRELIEEAHDDATRTRLRADWEELTLHPGKRLRAALGAHPETRVPLGSPPGRASVGASVAQPLALSDLALSPSVAAALTRRLRSAPRVSVVHVALAEDPHLRPSPAGENPP